MMTDKTRSSLHTLITKRYILAVTIIALLSSFAAYTLKSALSDVDNTAYIVNISGSQRMLSQHIALDIHRLYQQRFVMNTDQTETENLLTQHIDKMKSANHQLASGQLNNGHQLELSPAIRDIYFSDVDLYDRVNFYLKIATQILDTTSEEPFLQLMNEIDSSSENLLIDLDKAVNQYQREGDERLAIIKRLEVGVWLVTLLTLLLEVIFIFRPMAKEVIKSRDAEQRLLNSLEDQVELRTYKLEAANKKLQELASKDPLTNLNNRLTLEVDIETLIKGFYSHQCPFAIALIDIDFFKRINDEYGHLAGDHVLKQFAEILQSQGRNTDKVYRVGGEEFVLLLNRVPCERTEEIMLELIDKTRSHQFNFEGRQFTVTISMGLYHTDLFPVANLRDLFFVTDKALYESKANGRDRLTLATRT
jgi:two-component system, cell cycle response regulator